MHEFTPNCSRKSAHSLPDEVSVANSEMAKMCHWQSTEADCHRAKVVVNFGVR